MQPDRRSVRLSFEDLVKVRPDVHEVIIICRRRLRDVGTVNLVRDVVALGPHRK